VPDTRSDTIRQTDFESQWRDIRDAALAAVDRVGASGWLILGDEVTAFERELAETWGIEYAVGCASGLDAIEIGLRCAGVGPGDRVLTSPLSAFATALAVVRAGAIPIFVDIDDSGLLDLRVAEEALAADPRIRCVLPVHLYGHALDREGLERLRDRFGVVVVEDCAQAVGARSRGRPVGAAGAAAATSFYPTKNLGCLGDGGALLTSSAEVATRARRLRDYGQSQKYEHVELGLNSRLDELQAAIMRDALLPILSASTERRRGIASRYHAGLRNPGVVVPPTPEGSESVWHLFPVLVDGRDEFRRHLREAGVETGVHYPVPISRQPALVAAGLVEAHGELSRADAFAAREVSLPLHPYLQDEEVERVIEACNGWRL
jgi:dTDP-4-amino-4,6-dideoxygalactose transaminase